MVDRRCPICDKKQTSILKGISMKVPKEYHLPDHYNVVSCENCGFVYADTSASMEDYNWYYTHCNFYGDDSKEDNRSRYDSVKDFLERYVNKESVMLEAGAGNGRFQLALKNNGYKNSTGTDPSKESVDRMRKAGIFSYVSNIYESVPLQEEGKYDCVFLFEVAEHLLNPKAGIKNIARLLKKQGVFMISVPDYSKISGDKSKIANHFNLEHINYFSSFSLDNLMAGFGMLKIDQKHTGIDLIQVYRNAGEYRDIVKDEVTEKAVLDYFYSHQEKEAYVRGVIEKLRESGQEVVIWGTGSYVINLAATTALLDCQIKGFIDNNKIKQGRIMYGYDIYPPEFLKDKNYLVLICSMLNGKEIEEQLEAMHTKNSSIIL